MTPADRDRAASRRRLRWRRVGLALVVLMIAEAVLLPEIHPALTRMGTAAAAFLERPEVRHAPAYLLERLLAAFRRWPGVGLIRALLAPVAVGLDLAWFFIRGAIAVAIETLRAATDFRLLPAGAVLAIAYLRFPRLRCWLGVAPPVARPALPVPPPPGRPVRVVVQPRREAALAVRAVMGPAYAHLYDRVDPLTRTRFALGETFVLCGGGCRRPYKLATCARYGYRCPVDGRSLAAAP